MNKINKYYFFAIALIIINMNTAGAAYFYNSHLNKTAYHAAIMLDNNLPHTLDKTLPILSTSFVNSDRLDVSSTFGRLLGDQIASRFSQLGYKMIEPKLRKDALVMNKTNGEQALTRDLEEVYDSYDIQAMLVGTYYCSHELVFVSAKLVSVLDRSILSSYDFTVRLDRVLKQLLANELTGSAGRNKKLGKSQNGPIAQGIVLLNPSVPSNAKIIQFRLSKLGYYSSKIDGKWKKYSRKALKDFRKDSKITKVNKWDIETQKALFKDTSQ